jgi:integrase
MRTTITEALVRAAKPGFIRDDKLIGFALRTTANGFRAFVIEARVKGRVRRFTIAPADRMTVVDARNQAREILAGMSMGRDPAVGRRASHERSRTLQVMLDEYIEARDLKASSAGKYRAVVRRVLSDWLEKPIAEISPAQVRVRYEEIVKRSVGEANSAMRVLRAVARRAQIVLPDRADGSPAMRTIPTAALRGEWRTLARRTNVLEPHELGAWLRGLESVRSDASKRALTALLLTGLRANEALKLDWAHVGEDRRRLAIADSKTGPFVKIIGPRLVGMLAEWRDGRARGLVFPVSDLRSALERIVQAGGKGITPHDLRRTFASFAERAGTPMTTLKALMNHSVRDITIGYVQPSEVDLLHWAERIEGAVLAAGERSEVIPFDRSRA